MYMYSVCMCVLYSPPILFLYFLYLLNPNCFSKNFCLSYIVCVCFHCRERKLCLAHMSQQLMRQPGQIVKMKMRKMTIRKRTATKETKWPLHKNPRKVKQGFHTRGRNMGFPLLRSLSPKSFEIH